MSIPEDQYFTAIPVSGHNSTGHTEVDPLSEVLPESTASLAPADPPSFNGSTGTSPPQPTALDLYDEGWCLIPSRPDKRPMLSSWKPYQEERPSKEELSEWISRDPAIWSAPTGPVSGRFSLDFDGEPGRRTLEKLGLVPHRSTPNGGYHVDFEQPEWAVKTFNGKSAVALGEAFPGLDTRGIGGYINVLGGTDTGQYKWLVKDRAPYSIDLLVGLVGLNGEDLLEMIHKEPVRTAVVTPIRPQPKYQRQMNPTPSHRISQQAAVRLLRMALDQVDGGDGRNNAGLFLACQLRDHDFSWDEAQTVMQAYQRMVPHDNAKGMSDPYTWGEALGSLRQAYSRAPRDAWLPSGDECEDDDIAAMNASDGYRMNDVGNSYRLINLGADTLRYVHAWGKWLLYRDGRYIIDEKNAIVTEFAKQVPQVMLNNLPEPEYDDHGNDVSTRAVEKKFANASEFVARIQAMITLARGADGVIVDHELLDANSELLNVLNATVNLRTGKAQPHTPADLMTMQAPVVYDPDGKFEGSLWEDCLNTWQPDEEMRRYLQVRAGACATGIPTETFDVDYGTGANGKSKFHSASQHVLGPYSVVPHKSLLVVEKHEQHSTEEAKLFRARMAIANEVEHRSTLNEAMVKKITGGDRISARRMREDPWEFDPSHTLILVTNYKPIIKGTDLGIWRRVRLVPWDVTIPEAEQDTELEQKLREESSIILNWIIEGAHIFLNEGLKVPEHIRVATEDYRTSEDFVGRFVAECLTFDNPGARLTTASITRLADQWMSDQGAKWTLNVKDITTELERAGARNIGRPRNEFGDRETTWQGVDTVESVTL